MHGLNGQFKELIFSAVESEWLRVTQVDVLNSQWKLIVSSFGEELWDGSSNLKVIIIGGIENGHVILQSENDSGPGSNPGGHQNEGDKDLLRQTCCTRGGRDAGRPEGIDVLKH